MLGRHRGPRREHLSPFPCEHCILARLVAIIQFMHLVRVTNAMKFKSRTSRGPELACMSVEAGGGDKSVP